MHNTCTSKQFDPVQTPISLDNVHIVSDISVMSSYVVHYSMREAWDTHSVGVATYFLDYQAGYL